ncbi:uncharacterized protein EI90DRAFT_3037063 [Cantharellus anzutake]|uniref:uncharacterized protein n=1 Tax=Cantharellus anzutake TaxID=1750568 RepID=UPI001902E0B4|nr:uncharacterized protein EI90DRAFT_3037063 [Cantharellus anzutake]KAF8339553.1 hypothetical protein EI90DRAFT_3037063 [Cantharellus anzutake]
MGIRRHSKPMKSRFDGLEPEFEGPLLADDELCAGADAEGTPGSPTSPAPHSYPSPKQLSMSLPIASHLSPQSQSRSRSRTHGISITGAGAKPLHSTSKRSSFAYGTPSLLLKVALPFHSNSQAQSLSCSPSRHSHSHSRQFSAPINGLGKRTAEAVLSTVNAISSSVPQTSYFPSTSQHHPSHLSNPPTDSMATAMPLSSSKTRPSHSRVNSAELTMNINVMGPTTIPGGAIAYLKKTSTESYVPTYPLNPIPVRPGEKRKQLFHFARG